MPHKRNPILTENITGLARMIRAYVTPALENVALWHERDILTAQLRDFGYQMHLSQLILCFTE